MAYEAYRPDTTPRHPPTHPRYGYDNAPQYRRASLTTYTHPLKPSLRQSNTTTTTSPAPSYAPLAARTTDTNTKRLIRRLKLLSRLLAALLSLATFIPLALTLHKFLATRDETLVVQGEERTAWAAGTVSWYTYLYFGVAGVSLVLNAGVLGAYCCGGVGRANQVAEVEGVWANVQRAGEVVGWVVSVVIYRYGKQPDVEGKFKDLWGWTCSPAARAIQPEIPNVDFSAYCRIQTTSFYTGLLNVLAMLLSGVIYVYALVRMRSKKRLREAEGEGMEPLRR